MLIWLETDVHRLVIELVENQSKVLLILYFFIKKGSQWIGHLSQADIETFERGL